MRSLYLSPAVLASFDGQLPEPSPAPDEKRFSQTELNDYLASDRRKHTNRLAQLEKTLEDMSASKNLTIKERENVESQLEDLRKESRTKEEQFAYEKKQLDERHGKEVAAERKSREAVEKLYHDEKTERALIDAATSNDAFQPSQIVTALKPFTRLQEIVDEKTGKGTGKFKVLVDLPDLDEEGQPIVVTHTPQSAVRRLKERPAEYGNLFKSGVISGVGSQAGVLSGSGKAVDLKSLSQEQYMKIRAENPALLGLRASKRGGRAT
jgi:hypothetical protein